MKFYLVIIFVLCEVMFAGVLRADSLNVVFRYDDPSHTYVRAFLPGDFNGWGPNNSGVIDSNAVSRMQYDATNGWWYKSVRLKVGNSNYYKMHFHLNQSGSQSLWVPDPANPRNDGTTFGNSLLTVVNPMIFEPTRLSDGGGNITGLKCSVFGTHGIAKIQFVADTDSMDITSSYNSVTKLLAWTVPGAPISSQKGMAVVAYDSVGTRTFYQYWQPPPAPAYTVPEWSKHAVWYQIFPERFRSAETANDPVRSSLESWQSQPASWRTTPWTADWYSRDTWETGTSSDFYSTVFNRRLGGDLQGVIDKLGYLDSLGVNAIYLNPIFYARSLHKYDGRAHHHVDPYFGPDPAGDIALMGSETLDPTSWHWTSADTLFLGLLREAHRRGMHVIIDGVFNHTGVDFPAFQDVVLHQQNSIYKDWYIVTSWDNPATPQNEFAYHGWYGFSGLPEFADTPDGSNVSAGPKKYIYDITKRWMDPNDDGDPSDGIDGWRLDTVPDVPINFWTDWNTYLRTINPDAYTSSETWGEASATVRDGRFSATMNYGACAIPVYNFIAKNSETASSFAADMGAAVSNYGTASAQANQNLIDSHDTERLASMVVNVPVSTGYHTVNNPRASASYSIRKPNDQQRRTQRLMVLTQATIPGSPMVYYGDEAGMWGGNDPDDRMPMPWPDLTMSATTRDPRGGTHTADDPNFDPAIAAYYTKILQAHRSIPALQTGTYSTLLADNAAQSLIFERTTGSDKALVAINRDTVAHTLHLPLSGVLSVSQTVYVATTSETGTSQVTVGRGDTSLTIYLPAVTGAVLRAATISPEGIQIAAGWSMISLPRSGGDSSAAILFPHAASSLYRFSDAGYVSAANLQPGTGYWVKHPAIDTLRSTGADLYSITIPVHAGWNLIGSISTAVATSSIVSNPPSLVESAYFTFSGGYQKALTLQPGKGYWVKVQQAGTLTVGGN